MSQQSRRVTPGSTYTVQPGDTLWDIAQRAYNDPEDWDTIYDANKHVIGNDPNLIKPGQVLQIPSQSDPDIRKPVPSHTNVVPTPPPPPVMPPPPPPPVTPVTPPPPTPKPDSDNWFDTHIEDPLEKGIKKIFGQKEDS
jgi:LysM repeat protein